MSAKSLNWSVFIIWSCLNTLVFWFILDKKCFALLFEGKKKRGREGKCLNNFSDSLSAWQSIFFLLHLQLVILKQELWFCLFFFFLAKLCIYFSILNFILFQKKKKFNPVWLNSDWGFKCFIVKRIKHLVDSILS